jgi:hypothetical protein
MVTQKFSNFNKSENIPDKEIVQEALVKSFDTIENPRWVPVNPVDDQSSSTSLLIHEIFGGEILKTHKNTGWHFYNRIGGERIDFIKTESEKASAENSFEDIPTSPDETYNYFEKEDYQTFFDRFIRAFEESVGLNKFTPGYTT